MSNLYNINSKYFTLLSQLEEHEGELTKELEEALVINDGEFKEKAENYLKMITKWNGDIFGMEHEIERLQDYINQRKRNVETLKNNLHASMRIRGEEALEIGLWKIKRKQIKYVDVPDITALPKKYVKVSKPKPKTSADKLLIRKVLNEGKKVKGASIESYEKLEIK